jgi:hypothetical protein
LYSPSNLETSVDVPPISNPITGFRFSGSYVDAYPTTPREEGGMEKGKFEREREKKKNHKDI